MTQQQIEVDRSCSEVYKIELDSMGVDYGAGRAPSFCDWGVGQELHGHVHVHGHLLLYSSCKVIKSQ